MKTDKVKLLDVFALTVDLPEDKLFKGQVGTFREAFDLLIKRIIIAARISDCSRVMVRNC